MRIAATSFSEAAGAYTHTWQRSMIKRGGNFEENRLGGRLRLETGVRLAICDSLSLATVGLLNDLGAAALESQNRKPDPGLVSTREAGVSVKPGVSPR